MLNLLVGNEWLPGRMEAEKKILFILRFGSSPRRLKNVYVPFATLHFRLKYTCINIFDETFLTIRTIRCFFFF